MTHPAPTGLLLAVALLAGCASPPSAPKPAPSTTTRTTTAPTTARYDTCHDKAFVAMRDALLEDGNLDRLPKLPDRSLGITECKGLTTKQLDALAATLQRELSPYLLDAAARSADAAAPEPAEPVRIARAGTFCRNHGAVAVDRNGKPLHCQRNGEAWRWTR